MNSLFKVAAIVTLAVTGLCAEDVPAATQAKFIKVLASGAGSAGRVACTSAGLASELVKAGVTVDEGSKVAWASSEGELKALKAAGKLVICSNAGWLSQGGAIAVVQEAGKPKLYLNFSNIAASGLTLSDTVLRMGQGR